MADQKISQLTEDTALVSTNMLVEVDAGGANKKVSVASLSKALALSKSFVITSPTATADSPLWRAPVNLTITAIHVLCIGGISITGQMYEYDSNGLNGAVVDGSDIVGAADTNTNDDGALSNASIAAGNYIGWKTTSVDGTITRAIITFEYVVA
jgi:hypothetical protein